MENVGTGVGLPRGAGGVVWITAQDQQRGMTPFWTADSKLWLTQDRSRVVPDGHPDSAFLFCLPGDEVPIREAERVGLVYIDGSTAAGAVTVPMTEGERIMAQLQADAAAPLDSQTIHDAAQPAHAMQALATAVETGEWTDEALEQLEAAQAALSAATAPSGVTIEHVVTIPEKLIDPEGNVGDPLDERKNGTGQLEHKSLDRPEQPKGGPEKPAPKGKGK